MKKNLFYVATLAMALFMGACSSDDAITAPNENLDSHFDAKGNGYIRLSVSMPTTNNTRANDDLDDGTPDEYRVEDILLVLFSGANENDATLCSAYNLSDQRNMFATVGTTTDQITSSAGNLVAQIQRATLTEGANMYAFVILNDHQFYEVRKTAEAGKDYTTLWANAKGDVAGGAVRELTNVKFSDFKQLIMDESGRNYAEASFFMSNAPVVSDAANYWEGTPSTLVQFDASRIYPTYDEAKNNPAATINVERALAKVQCTWEDITKLESNASIAASILAWDLDNVNEVCYNTRNYSAVWNPYVNANATVPGQEHRFISPAKIAIADAHAANTTVHRTYWGIDPNYNGETTYPLFTNAGKGGKDGEVNCLTTKRAKDGIYYCPENTFNVEHQSVENTTRLVVAAQLNNGNPFYTLLEKNASVIYQTDGGANSIQQYIIAAVANRVNVRNWAKKHVAASVGEDATWAEGLFTVTFAHYDDPETATDDALTVADAGQHIATVAINADADQSLFEGATAEAKNAAIEDFNTTLKTVTNEYLANEYHFYYYPGGVSYYQALIKHFGDDLTPWSRTNDMTNVTIGANSIYGATEEAAAPSFLGRYGIVRNNWYKLSIQKINYVGSSVIPAVDKTPDDNVDNYISVRINILPWAIRTQQVIL